MLSNLLMFLEAIPESRTILTDEASLGMVICEVVIALLLLVLMFMLRGRFLKLMCACGAEIGLFLACKTFFGNDALLTKIMCWITAAVACIVTVSVVNRINWKNLRSRQHH